jgi:hypothetical protein
MSIDMHDSGYVDHDNVDISSVVIEKMKKKHPHLRCTIVSFSLNCVRVL